MTLEELERFKKKFHVNFIKTLTSSQFKYPPDTKSEAMIKWITTSTIFDSTVEEYKKLKRNKLIKESK
jgi:hypothetical protein